MFYWDNQIVSFCSKVIQIVSFYSKVFGINKNA